MFVTSLDCCMVFPTDLMETPSKGIYCQASSHLDIVGYFNTNGAGIPLDRCCTLLVIIVPLLEVIWCYGKERNKILLFNVLLKQMTTALTAYEICESSLLYMRLLFVQ